MVPPSAGLCTHRRPPRASTRSVSPSRPEPPVLSAPPRPSSADPERFAAEFAGSERTVAEYLLAEVLERQSEPVRRLLLRTSLLETLVRLGETRHAEAALAELNDRQRDTAEMRTVLAVLRLAQGDPAAATAALAPVLDDADAALDSRVWIIWAFLVEAIARDALRDGALPVEPSSARSSWLRPTAYSCPSSFTRRQGYLSGTPLMARNTVPSSPGF